MDTKINNDQQSIETNEPIQKTGSQKVFLSYASIIVGIIGLCLFFRPIPEIICGVGGLILSYVAKDKNASWLTDAVRRYGNYAAWVNIIWVCIEFGLKFAGFDVFGE